MLFVRVCARVCPCALLVSCIFYCMCVCLQELTSVCECECVLVGKTADSFAKKDEGQTEVVVNQIMNLDFLIFIHCRLKHTCCDGGRSRVIWLERRLIPKQQNCGDDPLLRTSSHSINYSTLAPQPTGALQCTLPLNILYACPYN